MSHSALGVRAVYNGSGSTGPFTLEDADSNPILFENDSDLIVTHIDTDGVLSVLTITTEYTLTGAGTGSAGTLTLVTALAVGEQLVVMRATALTQSVDLVLSGSFSFELIEDGLDKLTRITQELDERLDRAVLLAVNTDQDPNAFTFPEPSAGDVIGWNSAGDALINTSIPTFYVQNAAPATTVQDGSLWVDADSADLDLYQLSGGSWGDTGVNLEGAQGDPGDDGQTILSGSGAPDDGADGENGDFYIDTVAYDIYGPKTGGAWGSGTSLVGPAGSGSGDVTAAANFGTDNRLIRSDGTTKGVQVTGITSDDSHNVSGMATLTLPNTGLHLLDTNASHDLIIAPGSDLSADRTLTLTTGDSNRTLTIGADSSISGTAYVSGGTDVAIADGGTGQSTAAAAFGALKQDATDSATGVVELATAAEVRAATTGKALTTDILDSAAETVALSDAATVAIDWSAGINFTLTVTDNRTLGNPTNEEPGQWRTVEIVGNNATDRTLSFGSEYEVVPTLADIDSTNSYLITIYCLGAGRFRAYADAGGDPT